MAATLEAFNLFNGINRTTQFETVAAAVAEAEKLARPGFREPSPWFVQVFETLDDQGRRARVFSRRPAAMKG